MNNPIRLVDGDKLLEWLANEVKSVKGDNNNELGERYAFRKTGTVIIEGSFDIPPNQGEATKPNYTDTDINTALTRELTDERVSTAASYWLDCSPHERWEPDGIILARYARHMLGEATRLREALEWVRQRFEEEWTYELGTGEVVEEIIAKFEEALSKVDTERLSFSGKHDFKPGINTDG